MGQRVVLDPEADYECSSTGVKLGDGNITIEKVESPGFWDDISNIEKELMELSDKVEKLGEGGALRENVKPLQLSYFFINMRTITDAVLRCKPNANTRDDRLSILLDSEQTFVEGGSYGGQSLPPRWRGGQSHTFVRWEQDAGSLTGVATRLFRVRIDESVVQKTIESLFL
jgi:hypothetical protein